jgi:hypothetical protein
MIISLSYKADDQRSFKQTKSAALDKNELNSDELTSDPPEAGSPVTSLPAACFIS